MFSRIIVILALSVTSLSGQQPQSWEAPSSGWLYVLDRSGEDNDEILLIDAWGVAHGRILVADDAAFTVVNEGSALAILQDDRLVVFDVQQGIVTHEVDVADRVRGSLEPGFPYLFSSPSLVYVQTQLRPPEGSCLTVVSAFDPITGRLNGMRTGLPDCLPWLMMSAELESRLIFVPPFRNAVRFTEWVNGLPQTSMWILPSSPSGQPLPQGRNSGAMLLDGATRMVIVKEDTSLLSLDLSQREVLKTVSRMIPNVDVHPFLTIAADAKILVAASESDGPSHMRLADRILVFDAETLQHIQSIHPSQQFSSMTSEDGLLYVPTLQGGDILLIDVESGQQLRSIDDVGIAPAHVLVAP